MWRRGGSRGGGSREGRGRGRGGRGRGRGGRGRGSEVAEMGGKAMESISWKFDSSFPLPLPPHPSPLPVPPTAGGCQDIGCAHHCLDMPAQPQQPPAVSQPEVELQGKRRCFKHEIGGACQKNGENAEDDGGWGRKETLRNSLGMCALAGAYRRLFSALWTCRLS
ncbi:hypothetical protein BXZ70DRAFT_939531 [Cristinia sonorae]|uniref:Uncharacterized protein n=1 Tax=Cristinia sonorae TaxID=1940300 RepID=A0A8K0UNC5_9AGAR|nr:hypothetical protein BXZ70DRAFT_939531 [Cristinia sonorae]